jgi:hypothetical protein
LSQELRAILPSPFIYLKIYTEILLYSRPWVQSRVSEKLLDLDLAPEKVNVWWQTPRRGLQLCLDECGWRGMPCAMLRVLEGPFPSIPAGVIYRVMVVLCVGSEPHNSIAGYSLKHLCRDQMLGMTVL